MTFHKTKFKKNREKGKNKGNSTRQKEAYKDSDFYLFSKIIIHNLQQLQKIKVIIIQM